MRTFTLIMFSLSVGAFVVHLLTLTLQDFPYVVKWSRLEMMFKVLESLIIAIWAAFLLWR